METARILKRVCDAIEDKKGSGILILDLSGISSFTDFFVICQGQNQRQNQAISDAVREVVKKEFGIGPGHVEGYQEASWILVDYLNFVVHIFLPDTRQFFKLERLWSDGVKVQPEALSA